ncbi:carbohydrate-binding family 9-like protein [Odoribacter lunatus]|uniref:carbohydrate-binding family 9-like protein n=1 Tax=Odoribacter lunatus TaxID=2941335 RepID=UPI00203C5DD1|nr:carbohydrate-binding family 9-like protein [Odoribacter lunatus]
MYSIPYLPELSSSCMQEEDNLFDTLPAQPVACNNWEKEFPYAPQVSFRIAHNNEAVFIRFDVRENYTMAKVTEDNGEVWTDSCVEFFLALDDTGYYNFEFSCIGKALAGFRKERHNATHGTPEVMHTIKRHSSLGNKNFDERTGDNCWSLTVAIPATALFKHKIRQFGGLKATANVYKCGDHLSKPHFLSWQPIDTPAPNFHVPAFFTEVEFQK